MAAEWLAFGCKSSPLAVTQARSLLTLEFSVDAVLFEQVGDQSRLITVDEACERDEEQLQWQVGGDVAIARAPAKWARPSLAPTRSER